MNLRTAARPATVALAAALAVGTLAAPAWAPKYILGAFAFGTCDVPGQDASRFEGSLTALSFSSSDGTLYVTGPVVGTCYGTAGNTVATVPSFVATFAVVSLTTACTPTDAVVEVRPGAALVGGFLGDDAKTGEPVKLTLDLTNGTVLDKTWAPSDPMPVKARLCAVDAVAAHRPDASLASLLNRLVLG